jgi:hypothetical protein
VISVSPSPCVIPFNVDFAVSDGATVTATLAFTVSCATQTANLQFPIGANPANGVSWSLDVTLSGTQSSQYTPQSFTISLSTPAVTASTVAWALDTSTPSVHAGWQTGPSGAGGIATFSGTSNYLDLTSNADTHTGSMPTNWGKRRLHFGNSDLFSRLAPLSRCLSDFFFPLVLLQAGRPLL